MSIEYQWLGREARDEIVRARLEAYADAPTSHDEFARMFDADERPGAGDYLLARADGRAVGTAASLNLRMWVRGTVIPCQGVAWVGVSRTHRRGSSRFGGKGVGSQVMHECIRAGRERGFVVSALHPFRSSFYEHFGYGVVERRCEWVLPTRVLPGGSPDGIRLYEPTDTDAVVACLARANSTGQCDVERSAGQWANTLAEWTNGWLFVDRPGADEPVRGYFHLTAREEGPLRHGHVGEQIFDDTPALVRQLRFLATLRDQYSTFTLTLPIDLPLNLVLRETQIGLGASAHNHPTASLGVYNRMQLRVLDHKRLLEAIPWPQWARGRTVIGVQESEGKLTRLEIDVADGRAAVNVCTKVPAAAISDNTWAQIVTGDLTATRAIRHGLIAIDKPECLPILDALSKGPTPFNHEYF
jgi:predicted acetyltransferase